MKKESGDFFFANGYLSNRINNLLTKNDLSRIASAKDLKTAKSILREHDYDDNVDLIDNDMEQFIRKEQYKSYDLVFDTITDKKILGLFLFPYDYHNMKVFLKAEFLNEMPDECSLVSTGYIEPEKMQIEIKEREYNHFTANMKAAVEEALDVFARSQNPQHINIVLDKACYKDMLKSAQSLGNQFLIDFVKLQIDLINLKTFIRLKNIKKPWTFLKEVFIDGGEINLQFFIDIYEESISDIADRFFGYGMDEIISLGATKVSSERDFMLFEKMCDDMLMSHIKKMRYKSGGLEPIAAYWWAKEVEIDNLRIALGGLIANIDPNITIERLREAYV